MSQELDGITVGSQRDHTHRDRHCELIALKQEALIGGGTAKIFRSALRKRDRGFRQQQQKLRAFVATEQLEALTLFANPPRQLFDDKVAGEVAKVVVDLFDVIDVDGEQRQGPVELVGAGDLSLREAIVRPFASAITFDPTVFNGETADTILLTNGQLTIERSIRLTARDLMAA